MFLIRVFLIFNFFSNYIMELFVPNIAYSSKVQGTGRRRSLLSLILILFLFLLLFLKQVIEYGGPVYCLAWDSKQRQLFAGGRGVVQIFKVLRPSKNYMQMDSEKKASNYVWKINK